jgi:hypothetical protein
MQAEQLIEIVNWDEVKKVVDDVVYEHPTFGRVVIFTNANEQYIPTLIRNLHASFRIHEPERHLLILCSDRSGYELCGRIGYKHYAYVDIPLLGVSEYRNLRQEIDPYVKYTKLCFVKTVLMRYMLENGYTPLYIDPDMALKRPCIENLLSYLTPELELVVAGIPHHINTNIMIARPTSTKCIETFRLTVEKVQETLDLHLPSGDEPYTSTRILFIHKIPFVCVKKEEHPGGSDVFEYPDAYTVHANCIAGMDNKIERLKQCQGWFLPKVCMATLAIGMEFDARYRKLFLPSHDQYAKKCGYTHVILNDFLDNNYEDFRAITMNKLLIADQPWAKQYDLLVVLDGDIVINKDAPPIDCAIDFDDRIGVVCELAVDEQSGISYYTEVMHESVSTYYERTLGTNIPELQHIINTGLMVVQPNLHGEFLRKIYDTNIHAVLSRQSGFFTFEQAITGYELQKTDRYVLLPGSWNALWFFAKTYAEQNDRCLSMQEYLRKVYFLHLAGCCDHYDVPYLDN